MTPPDAASPHPDAEGPLAAGLVSVEARLRRAVANAPIPVMLHAQDGTVLQVSRAWTEITGYATEDLPTIEVWTERAYGDRREDALRAIRRLYDPGEPIGCGEYEVLTRDGRRRTWSFVAMSIGSFQGRRLGVSMAVDLTDRGQQERALRESEQHHRLLYETMLQGVVYQDSAGRIVSMNPAAERILGRTAAEYTCRTSEDEERDTIHEDGTPFPASEHPSMTALRTGREVRGVLMGVYNPREREHRWLSVSAVPLFRTGDAAPHQVYTLFEDVTERRRAVQALERSEARYRALFEAMTEGFAIHEIVVDAAGAPVDYRFLEVNPAFERLTGLAREQVVGRLLSEVLPGEDPTWVRIYGEVALTGEPRQFDQRSPVLGRHYEILAYSPQPRQFAVLFLDVTERKRTEAALRDSEERFRTLADNIPQLAWMADPSGWIFWYNRRWYEYTGTTAPEMEGWGWTQVHHPAHLEDVTRRWRDGLASGLAWEDTFPLRGKDGTYRWFLSRAVPIRDADGKVLRWFGTNTDVTEQREAADRLAEADRRKSEFISLLSHELRNPLAPIRNGLHILEQVPAGSPQADRAMGVLRRQVEHLTRLVDDLLDVTRIGRGKIELRRQRVELSELARRCCEDHRALFTARDVELRCDAAPPVWTEADPDRVAQVLGNLLQNAAKFTRPGGHAQVTVDEAEGQAEIRVRDDGVGIDPAVLGRLFEPFAQGDRTLTRTSGGLGLGLAVARGLVELHGGAIRAASEGPGRGAEFTVRLPRSEPAPPRAAAERASAAPGLDVLVIEDNVDSGQTLADVLALDGHRVSVATDGRSGIARARELRPAVIICDIGLPDLDGYAVARVLRADEALRSTHLIALSGYAQPEDRARAAAAGFDAHLPKPPPLEELRALLARR